MKECNKGHIEIDLSARRDKGNKSLFYCNGCKRFVDIHEKDPEVKLTTIRGKPVKIKRVKGKIVSTDWIGRGKGE